MTLPLSGHLNFPGSYDGRLSSTLAATHTSGSLNPRSWAYASAQRLNSSHNLHICPPKRLSMRILAVPPPLIKAQILTPRSCAPSVVTSSGANLASTSYSHPSTSYRSSVLSALPMKAQYSTRVANGTQHRRHGVSLSLNRRCPGSRGLQPLTHHAKGWEVKWPTYVAHPGSVPYFY